ncbi:hypothetical protein ACFFK0_23980 [Paenibacillus chartarius]|uniref:Uncharacterized protein n=2 Tax=Paenibacillus chartarius TaxID=747481 RepID=A0ABV6DS87_9BACL
MAAAMVTEAAAEASTIANAIAGTETPAKTDAAAGTEAAAKAHAKAHAKTCRIRRVRARRISPSRNLALLLPRRQLALMERGNAQLLKIILELIHL